MKNQILGFGFLLFISYNSFSQSILNQKKIDSITPLINRCLNCSDRYFERAKLYLEEGEQMKAMSDLNDAIKIHIEYFEKDWILTRYYNERAYLKADLEDYRGAIQDFNKALDIESGYASLWAQVFFGKAFCRSKVGDYEGAIKDYEKVFIHNPNDEFTYHNLGLLKIRLGRKNEGCLDLSKAGELGHSDAYNMIAEFCN